MDKLKLGIAGCGATVRYIYGPIMKYLENGELVALADPDEEALAWAQKMYGPRETYLDYDEFLSNADIEAVVIGSPVYLHQEQVIKAAQAGKHILCEKPMARTVAECDRMIEVCTQNRVTLMVAFMKRFDKSYLYAKQLIDEGSLGQVFQVRCDWSWCQYGHGGWRDSLQTLGGIFQDHGSHTIDLCRWWMGEIHTVSGEASILLEGRQVEDQAVAVLRHQNGGVSIHHMTRMTHKPLNEYVLIDGSRASLEIQHGPGWSCSSIEPFSMKLYENGSRVTDITRFNQWNLDEELKANHRYKKELEHFCDCILNDKQPLVTGEDGKKAIEAINAVYLSSYSGQKVKLPLKQSPDLEKIFLELRSKGIKIRG